ncbi:clathrin light chain B-like isoform X2 [Scyliorhinus canicula]|uniref:clathrin light chain B-like isoform X2 n=1 Tax=Scyliorhinus canicula TaxID=7830 RepID=UPI0018F4C66F|nr:clathrin light chain B-like isoform X2 [Scyliorhinus canicula]
MAEDFGFCSSDNGTTGSAEEDPAAAFLAQQESEIAGIENDEGFSILDGGEVPQALQPHSNDAGGGFEEELAAVNGEVYQESNCPNDSYAAIARADRLSQEPESIRKWREEQITRLEDLDAASRKAELEWKEKAKKELEEWYVRQNEQLEKIKMNNRAAQDAFVQISNDDRPGTEWDRVASLCDFNPKTNKQSKDLSRMRSVLMSLKQSPLVR